MTRQEHFEQWMRHQYPNIPLDYRSSHDYYVDDRAFYAYQAWKEAPLRRPCEKGLISKEERKILKEKDDPKTIVDRLNGWYSQTSEPYPVPKIQKEAAREIERLREAASAYMQTVDDGHLAFINEKLDDKNRDAYCKLWNVLNKNPAGAG